MLGLTHFSRSNRTTLHSKNRPVQACLRVWNWRLNPSRRFRSRLPARNRFPEKLSRNNPCAKKSLHRNRSLFPIGRSGNPSPQRKRRVKPWGLRSSSSRFTMLELPPHLRCRCSENGAEVRASNFRPICAAAAASRGAAFHHAQSSQFQAFAPPDFHQRKDVLANRHLRGRDRNRFVARDVGTSAFASARVSATGLGRSAAFGNKARRHCSCRVKTGDSSAPRRKQGDSFAETFRRAHAAANSS